VQVTQALAAKLGLDDPCKLRLTPYNSYSRQPQTRPLRFRAISALERMLLHNNQQHDILYYEVRGRSAGKGKRVLLVLLLRLCVHGCFTCP
jgi:hypothetical protein